MSPRTNPMQASRRALLRGAAAAILGTAPLRALAATGTISPVMAKLSAYMAEAGDRALPDAVVEAAKHHILDTFAAMVSGSGLLPAKAAYNFAASYGGSGEATLVAAKTTADPLVAALVNGMLAHSDETDDSNEFSQSHPGAPIVPAALAAAEKFGIDGTRFLRAVTLGYDVGPRVTLSFDAIPFRNTSHKSTHAIAGTFGAAAAAACAAGLDAQRMRWVLDYAAQQSSGIGAWTRDTQHIEKSFVFAGMPARSGLTAALMVKAGCTGIDDIFSGADNYFLAYAPDARLDELTAELGARYEIARTNIKKWTVGSPIQAPLDALSNILQRRRIDPEAVTSVAVRVAHTEARVVDNRDMPDICLQHMVAIMLLDGTASFQAAHDKDRMVDPTVLRLRTKVRLIPSDELERLEPARAAIVEIVLNDGTVLTDKVLAVRGTADNPMPRAEVITKCRDLMAPVLGADKTSRLIEAVLALETVGTMRDVAALLRLS
ncbi:MmgE/PrpD family protein [Methylobacterium sp. E-065]|uniref:MmgE/PrpD family protein n=1 Tax=Methylobacterium sp. E-065 TaxID=2836583 RepID=UPI001FBB16E5|nr:MmgE/PrpD family protein [Methylobacterium sp. E-065]MCJ2020631.1 MmgE/PrpD family protein [Methylobacterium sp. E-065]